MGTWIEIFAFCSVTVFAQSTLPNASSDVAQRVISKYDLRLTSGTEARKHANTFKSIRLVRIDKSGGWARAHKPHFRDVGTVDQIYGK